MSKEFNSKIYDDIPLDELRIYAKEMELKYYSTISSTSWKITKPLRMLSTACKSIINKPRELFSLWNIRKNNCHPDDYILHFSINTYNSTTKGIAHYFSDGKDSADKLKALCKEFFTVNSLSLLEFACGYGRVTRNLDRNYFDVTACDIHPVAINFITEKFGVNTVLSDIDPEEFDLNQTFDVVFALSFFSHVPDRTFGKWIEVLYKHVSPGGALIFTTHGKTAWEKHKLPLTDGFAFVPISEQKDLSTADYGITITEQSYVNNICEQYISKKPDIFREDFWWHVQDLYVINKSG